jgi:hypothetical protein
VFNRSKGWARALLVAAAPGGGAAGWGLRSWVAARNARARDTETILAHPIRELALSPDQRDFVRAVLLRRRAKRDTIWTQVRPRFDSLRQVVRGEIRGYLTTEQQQRFQRMLARIERARRNGGDSGRGQIPR